MKQYPLSILCVLSVWYACFFFEAPDTPLNNVTLIDKWTHVLMYFGTGIVMAWEYRRSKAPNSSLFTLHFSLFLMGGLIELLQAYCTQGRRSGEWLDWLADAIGVGLAALLAKWLIPKKDMNIISK